MIKRQIITLVFVLLTLGVYAQEALLSGRVLDSEKKGAIADVNILVKELRIGTSTDKMGEFSFKIPAGNYTLILSSIGYKNLEKKIVVRGDIELRLELTASTVDLGDVMITEKRPAASVAKINAPSLDVPFTFSSLSNEVIQQTQAEDVSEALKFTSGIRPQKKYGVKQTFVMRGFDKPVVMVDGMRDENFSSDPYAAPMTSLAAVERIEYLKGPASVLYGHSAVGGVLNIVRKQPLKDFEGKAKIAYGSWNSKKLNLDLGGNIAKGLDYRFATNLSNSDGWRNNKRKYANAYLALDYTINEKNKIEIRTGANRDHYTPEGGLPFLADSVWNLKGDLVYKKGEAVPGTSYKQRYNSSEDFMTHKNHNILGRYILKFSDKTKISLSSSYTKNDLEYLSTGEGMQSPRTVKPDATHNLRTRYYGSPVFIDITKLTQKSIFGHSIVSENFQNYLEFTSEFNTGRLKHKVLAGYTYMLSEHNIFYMDYDPKTWAYLITGKGAYATVDIANPKLNQGGIFYKYGGAQMRNETTHGAYLQDLIEITPWLKAMIGGRFDYFKYKYKLEKTTHGRELENKADYKEFNNKPFSYRAGFVLNPIKSTALYASYGSFFKPNRRNFSKNVHYIDKDGKEFFPEEGEKVFEPESGYQVETGIKYEISSKVQANLSAYYIKKKNILASGGKDKTDGKSILTQIGQFRSKGFEVALMAQPLKSLSLRTAYTFCDAKYEDHNIDTFGKLSYAGERIPNHPKHQFYAWGYYTVDKGTFKNLSLGLGTNYSSKMITSVYEKYSIDMPSYWVTDAAIGYKFQNVSLNLKINNIFNKEYYPNSTGYFQLIPGEERNVLLSVGIKF